MVSFIEIKKLNSMEKTEFNSYNYIDILNIDDTPNKNIYIIGRFHNIRYQKNVCFIIVRYQTKTIQCIGIKNKLKEKFQELNNIPKESTIKVYGELSKVPDNVEKIKSVSYQNIEIIIDKIDIITEAQKLPFDIEDAEHSNVQPTTLYNNRYLYLRTPTNSCIFKINSGICQFFRNYLLSQNFIEIHTPKIISTCTESGSNVFDLNYFNTKAYLVQSPQLYKQMAINSDFDRIFEIGPVFRAENSFTSRHLCEYTSLDIEMKIIDNYHEILEMIWGTLVYIFDNIKVKFSDELEFIQKKNPFNEIIYSKTPFIINFCDGVELLNQNSHSQDKLTDLSTENEKHLGNIIKEKYGFDLFILDKYPLQSRPFYTMPTVDKIYSNSFDIIMRGEEICSGSQRLNNIEDLTNQIKERKLDLSKLDDYIKSFSCGSFCHGGCALGLERIIALYLDIGNVRRASFCPRDPGRLNP